jgi:hypothetical protein
VGDKDKEKKEAEAAPEFFKEDRLTAEAQCQAETNVAFRPRILCDPVRFLMFLRCCLVERGIHLNNLKKAVDEWMGNERR